MASGPQVTGLVTMPASDRFTRSTCEAWSSTDRLRCSTPTPPWRAIAIAIRASVTVSMAELSSGTRTVISLVSRADVSTSPGHHVGRGRQQQDVVEGQADRRELVREGDVHGTSSGSRGR